MLYYLNMAQAIIELRNDVICGSVDVLTILRKAHLIASKLDLVEFDQWISDELNGYQTAANLPPYRIVFGTIKAMNPAYGMIPVIMPKSLESTLSKRKMTNSISEIITLSSNEDKQIYIKLPDDVSKALCKDMGVVFQCYFVCATHCFKNIVEHVKNTILQWCIELENKGIEGPEYKFSKTDRNQAKIVTKTINFYGPTQNINGNTNQTKIIDKSKNIVNFDYHDIEKVINEIKKETNKIENTDDRNDALEMIENISNATKNKKNPKIIKSMFTGLKDFLIAVGANVAAAIITAKVF